MFPDTSKTPLISTLLFTDRLVNTCKLPARVRRSDSICILPLRVTDALRLPIVTEGLSRTTGPVTVNLFKMSTLLLTLRDLKVTSFIIVTDPSIFVFPLMFKPLLISAAPATKRLPLTSIAVAFTSVPTISVLLI